MNLPIKISSLDRILVTGFEPFGSYNKNPSLDFVEFLKNKGFATAIFPVSFNLIDTEIQKLKWNSYEFIFMFGLSAERDELSLERVALNWIESSQKDNSGFLPLCQMIDESKPAAVINKIDLNSWLPEFDRFGLPVKISHSAGAFLCNYLYYRVLEMNKNCLFIHMPKENNLEKLEKLIRALCFSGKVL